LNRKSKERESWLSKLKMNREFLNKGQQFLKDNSIKANREKK
jgi:hypothetical protein